LQILVPILIVSTAYDYFTLEPCGCVAFPLMMRHETVLTVLAVCVFIIAIVGCLMSHKDSDAGLRAYMFAMIFILVAQCYTMIDFMVEGPENSVEYPGATYLTEKYDPKEADVNVDELQKAVCDKV
jgi:hypothetical protein